MSTAQAEAARYVSRATYWRAELAAAQTPAEQFTVAQRWLHALARQAEQTGRRKSADAAAFTATAEDAMAEAAQAVAEVCQRLEGRIAPGRETWGS